MNPMSEQPNPYDPPRPENGDEVLLATPRDMSFSIDVLEDDLLALQSYFNQNSKTLRRQLVIAQVIMAFTFLAAGFLVQSMMPPVARTIFIVAGIFIASIAVFFYPQMFRARYRRLVRRLMKEGKNRGQLGTHLMSLNAKEILRRNDHGYVGYYWTTVEKIAETNDHVFVFVGPVNALVIPKRCLDTQQNRVFVELLHEYQADSAGK